jgi:hypothetical protein
MTKVIRYWRYGKVRGSTFPFRNVNAWICPDKEFGSVILNSSGPLPVGAVHLKDNRYLDINSGAEYEGD